MLPEDQAKRMAQYKAMEREHQRIDNIDELNRKVLSLSFANMKLFQELVTAKSLNAILIRRLAGIDEPVSKEYTPDDLKMLKDMGIAP